MRVLLMRTCLSDAIAPKVWKATRRALERAGVEVKVPRGSDLLRPARVDGRPPRPGTRGGAAHHQGVRGKR